jgi:hypothetical protein
MQKIKLNISKSALFVSILLLFTILNSCQPEIQKRLYRKGFYTSWSARSSSHTPKENTQKLIQDFTEIFQDNSIIGFQESEFLASNNSAPYLNEVKSQKQHQETEKYIPVEDEVQSKKDETVTSNNFNFYTDKKSFSNKTSALYYFLSLLILPLFLSKSKNTKRISKWASSNILKSRLILASATVSGWVSSYFAGFLIKPEVSEWMLSVPLLLFGTSALIFYKNIFNQETIKKNYTAYSLFSTSSFFYTFLLGSGLATTYPEGFSIEDPFLIPPGVAVFVTFLIIGLLLVSIYLISILACELTCSGYTVLAGIVFFGGNSGAIYLAVWGILNLFKRKSKEGKSLAREALNVTAMVITALLILFFLSIIV